MRLCSIASGSSGNCIYVGSEATHLLVDVGISGKRTESGLRELGLTREETVPGGAAIRTVDRQDKVDLFSAPAIRRLEEMKGGEE